MALFLVDSGRVPVGRRNVDLEWRGERESNDGGVEDLVVGLGVADDGGRDEELAIEVEDRSFHL